MNDSKCRTIGAVWAVAQGLATALAPRLNVTMLKRTLGMNFENTGELEAKPAYLRQLRALGIGLAAAGAANLVLDRIDQETDDDRGTRDRTASDESE